MSENRAKEIVRNLSERFKFEEWSSDAWCCIMIHGGIGMDEAAFMALSETAKQFGDKAVSVCEMETTHQDFAVHQIGLDYSSFRQLKSDAISHFEIVLLPDSREWFALLTAQLETCVFGTERFISMLSERMAGTSVSRIPNER